MKYEIEKEGGIGEHSADDLINDEATEMLCRIMDIKRVKCPASKGSLIIWSSKYIIVVVQIYLINQDRYFIFHY